VNNLFSVLSHEFAEAATDAAVGLAIVYGPGTTKLMCGCRSCVPKEMERVS
ncbi:UNVERIFIED_CONTAM: hypothetical protein HDU68_004244, partial [Siphonaria sp. JEL0065]